jgi:murein DD-endopeptidase MepM/ murein hydrolase activator NlpD
MIEERVSIRLESLEDFQAELKTRRETMANLLPVPSGTAGTYGSIVIDNGFANDLNLNLGQFGGSLTANPNVPSIWPTTGVVTSPYGLRWGGTDFHPGIDIANDLGTPIVATADGIVEYAGWNAGGYGNMVDINHGNGLMTRYGHASQVVVTVGQYVKRGQLIAYMGSTGFSTGPHCHYEVHVSGQRVNPISYL